MMHGPWMFGRFFWIIPLMFFGFFLLRTFLQRRSLSGRTQEHTLSAQKPQTADEKTVSDKVPEALKEAGLQVLEQLDWDIRFLEKQRLETEDSKERQALDEQLQQKRDEYHATVKRLES